MTRLDKHDINEATEYLRQQVAAAERDNYRFAYSRGYAARLAEKPREPMYASFEGATAVDDAAWLDGWDAADAECAS